MDDEAACGVCGEEVTYDHMGICCDSCDKWMHAKCENINKSTYEKLPDLWYCGRCRKVNPSNNNQAIRRRLDRLKVGTLNCRGMKSTGADTKRQHLAEDMDRYQLDILAVQETHCGGDGPEEISTIDGRKKFMLYHSSTGNTTQAGTAFIVRKGTNVTFKPISDRICQMKIKANRNYSLTTINAYAPTLPVSEANPEIRDRFYEDLEAVVRATSYREMLIILGDFNAKTGQSHLEYPENIGIYGKGEINTNGKELLDFCNRQSLILCNTLFKHKMAHRTTWESSAHNSETNRRNPYRNMIDYIMVRKAAKHTVNDARSHNGLMTYTDHRLVLAKFNLERLHITKEKHQQKVDLGRLENPETKAKYQVNVEMKIMDNEDNWREGREMNAQERWDSIVKANHQAAEEVLGTTRRQEEPKEKIEELSNKQKEIGKKINSLNRNEKQKRELKTKRNEILTQIHQEIGQIRTARIEKEIREIEESKDDSNRMYKAVRNLQRMQKKEPLQIDSDDGITTDPKEQAEIVTKFFEKMFQAEEVSTIEEIPPAKMSREFEEQEIRSAVKSLKNNKSPGIDNITAEHLKNGPEVVYQKIAELLNMTAETGDFPRELNCGILVPLQKPGKRKGPTENLRPVILLSMLRKILAICLIRRIGERVDKLIPDSQAAYRSGRGTTEQLLTLKLLAEKAATTPNYEAHILLMDMSKAFDRVERGRVIEDLKEVLQDDELHLIKILMKDVELAVKIQSHTGNVFKTNIGVPQGDCLSPILFTLYLANALAAEYQSTANQENHTELPPHLRDHCYSRMQRTGTIIPLQYADDICWVGLNCEHSINNIKKFIPNALSSRNLSVNHQKTEEFKITRNGDPSWRKCRYLGTLLGSEEDIKRRKILANGAMRKIQHISKDKRIDTKIKIRAFDAYVSSIFLYNSETWTISKKTANSIDSYHRRILRNALDVKWPKKISTVDLYRETRATPWSVTIEKRRMRLYGHIMRLHEKTPVRQALDEYDRPLKMHRGAQKFTWRKNVTNDLCKLNLDRSTAAETAQDRKGWRQLIKGVDGGCRNGCI